LHSRYHQTQSAYVALVFDGHIPPPLTLRNLVKYMCAREGFDWAGAKLYSTELDGRCYGAVAKKPDLYTNYSELREMFRSRAFLQLVIPDALATAEKLSQRDSQVPPFSGEIDSPRVFSHIRKELIDHARRSHNMPTSLSYTITQDVVEASSPHFGEPEFLMHQANRLTVGFSLLPTFL
jgi:hypothetical protein